MSAATGLTVQYLFRAATNQNPGGLNVLPAIAVLVQSGKFDVAVPHVYLELSGEQLLVMGWLPGDLSVLQVHSFPA